MSIYKGTTLIAGSLPNAANQDLSNLSQTGQAVIDGKADVDLTNATDQAKILISNMAMPSTTYVDLTLGASGAEYTAPSNGWFTISKRSAAVGQYVSISNKTTKLPAKSMSGLAEQQCDVNLPVKKGDKVNVTYNAAGNLVTFRFVYAVGSESEA